MIFHK